ncbi:MAG: DMT family transporter [Elsteraceae bacterium]
MTRPAAPLGDVGRGILLTCLAAATFSAMSALVKDALLVYSMAMIVVFRTGFGLVPVLALLAQKRQLATLRTTRLRAHIFRGLCGLVAMLGSFTSYHLMPLADATAIAFTAPLFITALSAPFLGEKVSAAAWTAVIVGFLGVLIMARPGDAAFGLGALAATIGSLSYAFAVITMRQLTRTDPSTSVAFYNQLTSFLLGLAVLPWFWQTPTWGDLPTLIGAGIGGGVAQIWMTRGIQLAPVAVTAPFNYTQLIWAVAIGFFFFGDIPNWRTMAGAGVVVAAGLFILYREGRR